MHLRAYGALSNNAFVQELCELDRTADTLPALLPVVVGSPIALEVHPTLLAAAMLAVARSIKGCMPMWPAALQVSNQGQGLDGDKGVKPKECALRQCVQSFFLSGHSVSLHVAPALRLWALHFCFPAHVPSDLCSCYNAVGNQAGPGSPGIS